MIHTKPCERIKDESQRIEAIVLLFFFYCKRFRFAFTMFLFFEYWELLFVFLCLYIVFFLFCTNINRVVLQNLFLHIIFLV